MLLFFGCAAMILARTKIAPHADCKIFQDKQAIQIDELFEKFKHRGKQAGGRARGAQKIEEAEVLEEVAPALGGQTADFQRIVRENASRKRLG